MQIEGTIIEDTAAEAFAAWVTKLIVTAADAYWLDTAIREATGYGTSVIGCDAEAGVAGRLGPRQTPDGRIGAVVMLFARKREGLIRATCNRVGQALLTCPTVSVFSGVGPEADLESARQVDLGRNLRYFGDGFEERIEVGGRDCWRIPVMDGYFVVEDSTLAVKGVAGGNLLVCAVDQQSALAGARRAVDAVADCPDVITPFAGGVVRSGSKVGSRYKGLIASTNDPYCAVLRGKTRTALREEVGCVYEIIINGLTLKKLRRAMGVAVAAACGENIVAITAASFGGKLGRINLNLQEMLAPSR